MPPNTPATSRALSKWMDKFPKLRVGVVGDFAADHYLVGATSRISREAPVLILKKREDSVRPGQAGNSAANLAALGVKCYAFGVVGDDAQGDALLAALEERKVNTSGLIASRQVRTLVKTRILAGAHHATSQQVIRLDDDEGLHINKTIRKDLSERLRDALPRLDAILVSDYGYGSVDAGLWKLISGHHVKRRGGKTASGKKHSILRVVDSRYALKKWKGADIITPNETEVFAHLGLRSYDTVDPVEAGRRLIDQTKCEGMVMTRGNEGMIVFSGRGRPRQIPIFGSDEVTDVTGAGDTVAAVVTAVCAAGGDLNQAATLANIAGGLVVMKRGAAVAMRPELRRALERGPNSSL